jgi:hypothetical protein
MADFLECVRLRRVIDSLDDDRLIAWRDDGDTLLHLAAFCRCVPLVLELVARCPALVKVTDGVRKKTPLHCAVDSISAASEPMLRAMVEAGGDLDHLNVADQNIFDVVMREATPQNHPVVTYLKSCGWRPTILGHIYGNDREGLRNCVKGYETSVLLKRLRYAEGFDESHENLEDESLASVIREEIEKREQKPSQ